MTVPCEKADDIADIKKTVDLIHDKLFVGNGAPPLTMQVAMNAQKLKLIYFLGGATILAVIGSIIGHFIK